MDIDDDDDDEYDELMIIISMVICSGVLDQIFFLNLVCDNYLGKYNYQIRSVGLWGAGGVGGFQLMNSLHNFLIGQNCAKSSDEVSAFL